MLDEDLFKMQMKRLAAITRSEISLKLAMDEYYPKFNSYSNKRFAEIIEYLVDTWKYKNFPSIADFNTARDLTVLDPEFTPSNPNPRDPNYCDAMNGVLRNFEIMDMIREIKIPNHRELPAIEICFIIHAHYTKMAQENKVFSVQTKKWVSLKNAIKGEYFDPAKMGFPVKAAA